MFSFSLRGVIVGMNSSKDGDVCFLKVKPELVEGVRVQAGDTVGNLDVTADKQVLGPGVSFNSTVIIDGFGYNGQRPYTPPASDRNPSPKAKLIDNARMIARTVKLAK